MKSLCARFFFAILFLPPLCYAQQQKVRNVILMIPDGCSQGIVSLARWYNGGWLHMDPYFCGNVKTHSADSSIADSAPAATALATGNKSVSGFVGVTRDTIPVVSVLELARNFRQKKTGMVFTCRFPHATPAAFVCHSHKRSAYDLLAGQFAFNSPDVVFGGGTDYFNNVKKNAGENFPRQIRIIGAEEFSSITAENLTDDARLWCLFRNYRGEGTDMSYYCDRISEPGLSEMTSKAIELLGASGEGFFLMVEGSQVDWAAHANDPYAAVTEFLEFDRAVGVALKYAQSNDSTVVIVCPDHGTGGPTPGNFGSNEGKTRYDKLNIAEDIILPLQTRVNYSALKVMHRIRSSEDTSVLKSEIFKNYYIELSGKEILNFRELMSRRMNGEVEHKITAKLNEKLYIGWTTTGHTGEDVFLAVYAPSGVEKITGLQDNTAIAAYIMRLFGLGTPEEHSRYFFEPDREFRFERTGTQGNFQYAFNDCSITLIPNTNYFFLNGVKHELSSLIFFSGRRLFAPAAIFDILEKECPSR